jgi:Na+-transporting methylmalonyl-CoA/oxaloacetate decarboxylase gamma subunit
MKIKTAVSIISIIVLIMLIYQIIFMSGLAGEYSEYFSRSENISADEKIEYFMAVTSLVTTILSAILIIALNILIWRGAILELPARMEQMKEARAQRRKAKLESELKKLNGN